MSEAIMLVLLLGIPAALIALIVGVVIGFRRKQWRLALIAGSATGVLFVIFILMGVTGQFDTFRYGSGQTWIVHDTTWDNNGLPLLSEPIKEIAHYNSTRQFRQEGVLEGFVEPNNSGDLEIYIIRKHEDFDDWLRIEVNNRAKDNGWTHTSWILTAEEIDR